MSVIRQLLFPGKKPKEIIETGDDDEIDTDPDAGKKKVRENLKLLVLVFAERQTSLDNQAITVFRMTVT